MPGWERECNKSNVEYEMNVRDFSWDVLVEESQINGTSWF